MAERKGSPPWEKLSNGRTEREREREREREEHVCSLAVILLSSLYDGQLKEGPSFYGGITHLRMSVSKYFDMDCHGNQT